MPITKPKSAMIGNILRANTFPIGFCLGLGLRQIVAHENPFATMFDNRNNGPHNQQSAEQVENYFHTPVNSPSVMKNQ